MRLRCANDRAADIGNYSLRNLRAPSSPPPPSPPPALSLPLRAFVSYRPSLSFPPPSSFSRRIIFRPRTARLTRRNVHSQLTKNCEAAIIYLL